jgi:type I restriction-modification system DNA methylase subunit
MNHFSEKVSFIWSVADLLRGPYKPAQYGRVILPLTVLRRLDCVLEPTKEKVLAKHASMKGSKVENIEPILNRIAVARPGRHGTTADATRANVPGADATSFYARVCRAQTHRRQ